MAILNHVYDSPIHLLPHTSDRGYAPVQILKEQITDEVTSQAQRWSQYTGYSLVSEPNSLYQTPQIRAAP